MNRRALFGGVVMSFGLSNSAFAGTPGFVMSDAPKPMPELQFTDHDGKALTLKDFSGRTVLLNIWATWCGPCRKEMPALDRLQAALGGPNFMVLPVSIDRKGFAAVDVFYVDIGIQHLAAYVAPAANHALDTLGIWGLPASLLLDPQGRELGRLEGPAEWDAPPAQLHCHRQSCARRVHNSCFIPQQGSWCWPCPWCFRSTSQGARHPMVGA